MEARLQFHNCVFERSVCRFEASMTFLQRTNPTIELRMRELDHGLRVRGCARYRLFDRVGALGLLLIKDEHAFCDCGDLRREMLRCHVEVAFHLSEQLPELFVCHPDSFYRASRKATMRCHW
jgi:hypothetical protein